MTIRLVSEKHGTCPRFPCFADRGAVIARTAEHSRPHSFSDVSWQARRMPKGKNDDPPTALQAKSAQPGIQVALNLSAVSDWRGIGLASYAREHLSDTRVKRGNSQFKTTTLVRHRVGCPGCRQVDRQFDRLRCAVVRRVGISAIPCVRFGGFNGKVLVSGPILLSVCGLEKAAHHIW